MKTKQFLLSIPCVLLFAACDDGYYHHDPAVYRGTTVDFHYVSGRPYSRHYGPLHHREGRYYYSRGGRYVVYDRPTTVVIRRDRDVGTLYDRRDTRYRHRSDRDDDDRRRYRRSRDDDRRDWRDRRDDDDEDEDRIRRRGPFGLFR